MYTVKEKVHEFPVPSRDVTTKLSLGGNNDVITELFLPRGSLVSDIPAGDGKLVNLFLRCMYSLSIRNLPTSFLMPCTYEKQTCIFPLDKDILGNSNGSHTHTLYAEIYSIYIEGQGRERIASLH
jgi:hypothetical protein